MSLPSPMLHRNRIQQVVTTMFFVFSYSNQHFCDGIHHRQIHFPAVWLFHGMGVIYCFHSQNEQAQELWNLVVVIVVANVAARTVLRLPRTRSETSLHRACCSSEFEIETVLQLRRDFTKEKGILADPNAQLDQGFGPSNCLVDQAGNLRQVRQAWATMAAPTTAAVLVFVCTIFLAPGRQKHHAFGQETQPLAPKVRLQTRKVQGVAIGGGNESLRSLLRG